MTPVRFTPDSLRANEVWFWHGPPVFSPDLREMHWTKHTTYPTYQRTELAYLRLDEHRWSSTARPSFADLTRVEFVLPARCLATLAVYDVRGALVRTLVQRELEARTHHASWDGLDSRGRLMSSRLYFCRLTACGQFVSRKLMLVR